MGVTLADVLVGLEDEIFGENLRGLHDPEVVAGDGPGGDACGGCALEGLGDAAGEGGCSGVLGSREGGAYACGRDKGAGAIVDGDVGDVVVESGESGGDGVGALGAAIDADQLSSKVAEPGEALAGSDDDDLRDFGEG